MTYAVPSVRAALTEARTYLRPTNAEGTIFETPEQAADRIIGHQRWLWERAKGGMQKAHGEYILVPLTSEEEAELQELRELFLNRMLTVSGRTRWLGGTKVSRTRESSQFNCSYLNIQTVHDVVDATWLLLQGCGVGFKPITGTLNGFAKKCSVKIIRSKRGPNDNGREDNVETWDPKTGVWTISIGDSSTAWAKSIGKILAGKYPAKKLIIDMSEIRGPGGRLKSYGWISSGDQQISVAYDAIARLMNKRAGKLLTAIDILDTMNWIGTILSSRRSAEIALMDFHDPEAKAFAVAKKNHYPENPQRAQSNNSLVFYKKPSKAVLTKIFATMLDAGGSEPGFLNAEQALKRAAWFKGTNPCGEILLGDKSFCNLVEVVLPRFNGDVDSLHHATRLVARANYRQTCVDLRDEILQAGWHELNNYLHLCGVGVTGVVSWEHQGDRNQWANLRVEAQLGADSMADELNMPRSKAVTTVKPSGTQSKALGIEGMEIPEGIHKPLGRYIFNRIRFSTFDPLVAKLQSAGYQTEVDPYDPTGTLVVFPVQFQGGTFDVIEINGKPVEVNLEPAVAQLERYKMVMENYVDHNSSITISYSPDETPAIVEWLHSNWDVYVGVSFILRTDPTKTAQDLSYPYLPQTVVSQDDYEAYTRTLKSVILNDIASSEELDNGEECANGSCPVR